MLTYKSHLNQIHRNLALEHAIVQKNTVYSKKPILFLWRNRDCVVIGRNQNPYSECNVDQLRADHVDLCRRRSGGGAVKQDLGNTVFSIIQAGNIVKPEFGMRVIVNALKSLGVDAQLLGRNDIVLNGAKISGHAYSLHKDRFVHHGTILRSPDFESMSKYLTPSPLKFHNKKGTPSIKQRVTSIEKECNKKVDHDTLCDAIQRTFVREVAGSRHTAPSTVVEVDLEHPLIKDPVFKTEYNELTDEKWTYGATPPYEIKEEVMTDYGLLEIRLKMVKDVVVDVQVFTDALDTSVAEKYKSMLKSKLCNGPRTNLVI